MSLAKAMSSLPRTATASRFDSARCSTPMRRIYRRTCVTRSPSSGAGNSPSTTTIAVRRALVGQRDKNRQRAWARDFWGTTEPTEETGHEDRSAPASELRAIEPEPRRHGSPKDCEFGGVRCARASPASASSGRSGRRSTSTTCSATPPTRCSPRAPSAWSTRRRS